jgi:hypothetical protein
MSTRKQLATSFPNRRSYGFAGTRWLALAHRLSDRYRIGRRRLGMNLQWRHRRVRGRGLWERCWASPASPGWQVNIGFNFHVRGDASGTWKQSAWTQLPARTLSFYTRPLSLERDTGGTWVTNSFVMKRFVARQIPIAVQPMRMLAERVVHTSVRAVVREKLRVEHRLLAGPFPRKTHRDEPNSIAPQVIAPRETQAPVAVPIGVPDINIAHIADQVMRQLDHRISAWRERRGRV